MIIKAEETVKQTSLQINPNKKISSINKTGKESRNVGWMEKNDKFFTSASLVYMLLKLGGSSY